MKNNFLTTKNITLISCIALLIVIWGYTVPADKCVHGYFCDEVKLTEYDTLACSKDKIIFQSFIPKENHLKAVEIYLNNIPKNTSGYIEIAIKNYEGKTIFNEHAKIAEISSSKYYKVYCNLKVNSNKQYTLELSSKDCNNVPSALVVSRFNDAPENINCSYGGNKISGGLYVSYAYSESTFTKYEKWFISIFILCLIAVILSNICFNKKEKIKKIFYLIVSVIGLMSLLAWTFMYNSFDNNNTNFNEFDIGSETLVTSAIVAEHNNVNLSQYGIGRYYNTLGSFLNYSNLFNEDNFYLSNDIYEKGYAKEKIGIAIANNVYTQEAFIVGNFILFENGNKEKITSITSDSNFLYITLDSSYILSESLNGSLYNVSVLASNGSAYPVGKFLGYQSLFGLQGKIFRHMAKHMEYEHCILNLNFLCCIALAIVLMLIVIEINKKYNILMAGIFYITFWLSPWIINFAKNLYWVEFTWFLPMLIGLIYANHMQNKKIRIGCYVVSFICILGKSLCGYEYMTTIMLGLIAFLLVDLIMAIIRKNKTKAIKLFKGIFILGCSALSGLFAAILIHARLRGEGNIVEGLIKIFKEDVLRRTIGGNLDSFDEIYRDSLNASIYEVLCKYFHFSKEVISGIDGSLFPILAIIPIFLFLWNAYKKNLNYETVILYFILFITSISWYVLGKSHSYIHTHLNYVLWYFGYIQICIYIITTQILNFFNKGLILKKSVLEMHNTPE